jgi:PD-(D/E)XK nuclease superfamily
VRYFTHSELNVFNDCRRRWWLSSFRHLRPKFRKVTGAAPIGTRIHSALAPYYVPAALSPVDPRETLEAVITADRAALLESIQEAPTGDGWMDEVADPSSQLKDFESEAELCRIMIAGYMEWLAETGADSDYEVVVPSESAISYEFRPGESLAGRLDAQVVQISTGAHLGIDHKTGDFADLRSTLRDDDQMLRYEILRRTRMPEARSDGMLFNMLRKVKRTAKAKPPFYDRMTVNFNAHQIESAWVRTMGIINDIREVEQRLLAGEDHRVVVYKRRTRDCSWRCEFFNVCNAFDDGSRVEDMITSLYTVGSPTDRYPELTGGSE